MKISYNTLKKYIPNIKSVEEIAQDLIMHTAEVEKIIYSWENLKNVYIWEIKTCIKHPDSKKLNCTTVEVNWKTFPIVCWAENVKVWLKVPVALVWAKLSADFEIKKTKIRWETSEGMICSEDELWLIEERQAGIMELDKSAPIWVSMKDYLWKNEAVLEIDNKAINHRPDLFSHIGIIREIFAISWKKFEFEYENKDFSWLDDLWIKNEIPKFVKRYMALKISWVNNQKSPDYIKEVLEASNCESKWLLIDLTNYSLYLYGQPTHIFDADKIKWNISIRYAKNWEKFLALDNKEYELRENDIVISDDEKILALWWIIWGKESSVSETTKNIIIESANFDQAIIRKTGKNLWIRTDSLNVFEKDILTETAISWLSLIVSELEKFFPNLKLESFSDNYPKKQKKIIIDYDLEFINNLIWKKYTESNAKKILENLWIKIENNKLVIPFWRKDLNYKADIAEEIARIDWYNNIKEDITNIQLWAIIQDNLYKIKQSSRNFFINKWFFDMYTYSFVNENLMKKCNSNLDNAVALKNYLSEDATHMRPSLIPNLLLSIEKNYRDFKDLKLFEIEKIFKLENNNIIENYNITWVITNENNIIYYDLQNILAEFFKNIWIYKFFFEKTNIFPDYSHKKRISKIIIRWQEVWYIWEIKPKVANNFWLNFKIWFFEINIDKIKDMAFEVIKVKEISNFQSSNFDISFLIDKKISWNIIKTTIEKTNPNIIKKVDLFDIYENEEKLPWKRSLSFKIYLQKLTSEITDMEKNDLIKEIVSKVEKKGWIHR